MTADANGFYKYTITGPTAINLIFNNGSGGSTNQTPDLIAKTDGFSYTWGDPADKTLGINTNKVETTNVIRVYPNPVSHTLQIQSVINSMKILFLKKIKKLLLKTRMNYSQKLMSL